LTAFLQCGIGFVRFALVIQEAGLLQLARDEPRRQPHDLWKLAVLGGLVVLLTEWWVYNKRLAV
jgi:hypothetical protein